MSSGVLTRPIHIPTEQLSSVSYVSQSVRFILRRRVGASLSLISENSICLWSDIVSASDTFQCLISRYSVLLTSVTAIMELTFPALYVGVGHFEHKFQGLWGVAHQRLFASENYSPWAIKWRCLRDPMFTRIRFDTILACDRHTHRQTQTHDDS